MGRPKIGHINFINCLPLTYSFKEDHFDEGLNLHFGVPSILNNDVINGRLDISPVSSIVYARNSEKLLLLPDVCITADGAVQSILLVSKKPAEELKDDKIILTAKSATSHALLKIILNQSYGARPNYYIRIVDMENIIPNDASATLLIGDDALYTYYHQKSDLYYYDLGREWKKLTGLCMVYAVWVVNRRFAAEKPDLLQLVYDRIVRGFQNGCKKKKKAVETLLCDKSLSLQQSEEYLDIIQWNFGQEQQQALLTFFKMAHEKNLIDHVPKLNFAEVIR